MGTWDNSVTGNDTAQDLKSEYQAAFFYNDVETALRKIDDYIADHTWGMLVMYLIQHGLVLHNRTVGWI